MDIIFESIKFGREEIVVLEPGAYEATLINMTPKMRKTYDDPNIEEEVLLFTYQVDTEEGTATIFRNCTPTLGQRSNLHKDLLGMAGKDFLAIKEKSDAEVRAFISALVGKTFLLQVAPKTSTTGKIYNNFVSVSAPPKSMIKKEVVAPAPATAFDKDEIPF